MKNQNAVSETLSYAVLALVGCALMVTLSGCGGSQDASVALAETSPIDTITPCAPLNGHTLYVYGDSIMYQFTAPSYPGIIACSLGYTLVNSSIPGTSINSANQYPRIMADAPLWKAGDVVLYAPGANDTGHPDVFTQLMGEILTRIAQSPVTAYIGTPYPFCVVQDEAATTAAINSIATISRTLFASDAGANTFLVDFNTEFTATVANTLDCMHPNAEGKMELAGLVAAVMAGGTH